MKKHLKKLAAMALCCMLLVLTCSTSVLAAASADSNLLRYIPTEMTVTSSKVLVKGYFVNMNSKATISNLEEVSMLINDDDEGCLASGDFGILNRFTIKPQGMVYQEMEFSNSYGLKTGTYVCESSVYADFSCTYTIS